ncbi:co-chaperone DjlA [Permianibacter aggregans]|uniref:Co-chaperone protein DjlA n=1 Tax=Permianibacter aggregans TaxID=1510150 RepID=A0A4R6UM17_9GAMM|nr:co-chaperone DjlA [Permianibacter aggregans]TDQ47722.1 DnaJ like chaperone protein [Permianibacter aggregans]
MKWPNGMSSWWGKAIGGGVGYLMGGYLGALIGAVIGHQVDKGATDYEIDEDFSPGAQTRVQTAFFTATFSVLGHLAKADGRVSEQEIAFAQEVMRQFSLNEGQKKVAIDLFNKGKETGFDLYEALRDLKRECLRRQNLLQTFLEIQIQAVLADGEIHDRERLLLLNIGSALGFNRDQLDAVIGQIVGAQRFHSSRTGQSSKTQLQAAYETLGVKASDDDETIKKAYRRLMAQHHPDKLVAQGLPEEMMKEVTARAQSIQDAYQLIKKHRGNDV